MLLLALLYSIGTLIHTQKISIGYVMPNQFLFIEFTSTKTAESLRKHLQMTSAYRREKGQVNKIGSYTFSGNRLIKRPLPE